MAGVRRVARSILRYVVPLYVFLIVLQVYFAGEGIFGAGDARRSRTPRVSTCTATSAGSSPSRARSSS